MPGHVLYGWRVRDLLSYLEKQGITFKDGQFFDKDGKPIDKEKGIFKKVEVSNREQHTPETKAGHWNNGKRKGATLFPDWMSKKQIMDAVVATIEYPDMYEPPRATSPGRTVRKTVYFYVDGEKKSVTIEAKWKYMNGEVNEVIAYPVYGDDVNTGCKNSAGELEKAILEDKKVTQEKAREKKFIWTKKAKEDE